MNQDAKDDLACGGWIAAFIAVLIIMAVVLCGAGCCSITVRTSGAGAVSVHQTRVVSTDASIPASLTK